MYLDQYTKACLGAVSRWQHPAMCSDYYVTIIDTVTRARMLCYALLSMIDLKYLIGDGLNYY